MPSSKTLCSLFLCLFVAGNVNCQTPAAPPNVFHMYRATYFALPSHEATLTTINNQDVVAGTYSAGSPTAAGKGYLRYPDGRVDIFSVPRSVYLTVIKLTDQGELLGQYYNVNTGGHTGFTRSPTGKLQTFQLGGAAGSTMPTGLNIQGQVFGTLSTTENIPPDQPFLRYRDGQYMTFDVEGSDYIGTFNINDGGVAVGTYLCPVYQGGVCGFYGKPGGTLTTFSYEPNGLLPTQINNNDVITGVVYLASGREDGFLRMRNGKLVLFGLDNLDALNVEINNRNEVITDYYAPPPPGAHGPYDLDIIRTADGKIGNYDPPFKPGSLRGDTINDRGVIAGPGGPAGFFLLIPKE